MNKSIVMVALLSATMITSGCAPRIGGDQYSVYGAGEVSQTNRGAIVAMRPVNISASSTGMDNQPGTGAAIGSIGGAVLGSQIGNGRGQAVAGLLGAVAGGVAGHFAGQAMTDQQGFEYQVQLDRGDLITIAQGAEPRLHVGQRVLVIQSTKPGGRGRITADNIGY